MRRGDFLGITAGALLLGAGAYGIYWTSPKPPERTTKVAEYERTSENLGTLRRLYDKSAASGYTDLHGQVAREINDICVMGLHPEVVRYRTEKQNFIEHVPEILKKGVAVVVVSGLLGALVRKAFS